MKIKIAVEHISNEDVKRLEKRGYEVVVRAEISEPDDWFLRRALNKKALFVISNDADIPRIIENKKYPMIWVDRPRISTSDDQYAVVNVLEHSMKQKIKFIKKLVETDFNTFKGIV